MGRTELRAPVNCIFLLFFFFPRALRLTHIIQTSLDNCIRADRIVRDDTILFDASVVHWGFIASKAVGRSLALVRTLAIGVRRFLFLFTFSSLVAV